jgi:hypothetical protein
MRHIVRHLALLALLGQAVGGGVSLLAVPAAPAAPAMADGHACCKGMAPGAACPMHKGGVAPADAKPSKSAGSECRLSSGCAPRDIALIGIGSQGAIVPARTVLDPALADASASGSLLQPSSSWIQPPTARPPRA